MPPVLGYFLCLAVLTPALSLDVFLGLLGKTPRQHDVLAIFATLLQLLATVTSPVKVAISLGIVFCAIAARRATRRIASGVR
ncbi:MAG: hypothetical protein ACREH8_12640 [Opitutaceae bacterium]